MEKILGNFLSQPNMDFPLDAETLGYLQDLSALAALVGNIAGDKVVICGCEPTADGTRRAAGYVFIRTKDYPTGEILPWEGGVTTGGMYIRQEDIAVTANNIAYRKAYTKRSLAPGLGTETYSWDDFADVSTIRSLMAENTQLRAELSRLQPPPAGVVELWAGKEVPQGYMLCDGSSLRKADYAALYAAIGDTFNKALSAGGVAYSTPDGYFRVPDLRGRFVVGQHDSDDDYKQPGTGGGLKSVSLSNDEMPEHNHEVRDYYYCEDAAILSGNFDRIKTNDGIGSKGTDKNNNALLYYEHTTSASGHSRPHENRPPYYVLAYIIRVE